MGIGALGLDLDRRHVSDYRLEGLACAEAIRENMVGASGRKVQIAIYSGMRLFAESSEPPS